MTPRHPDLTDRQERVLDLLADGRDLHGAARCMGITYNTARWHLLAAERRLEATTMTHAVALWVTFRERTVVT